MRQALSELRQIAEFEPNFKLDKLPPEINEKFELIKKPLDFHQKSELLSWFVDSMRAQVLNHFETENLLNEMEDSEKVKLYSQLEQIVEYCRSQLFDMHQKNQQGTYVQENENTLELQQKIADLKSRIDIIRDEKKQLMMIKAHNQKVDAFCNQVETEELPFFKQIKNVIRSETPKLSYNN